MIDIVIGIVIATLIGAAVTYIVRAKKKGVACIGCPAAGTCSKCTSGCKASCSDKDKIDKYVNK